MNEICFKTSNPGTDISTCSINWVNRLTTSNTPNMKGNEEINEEMNEGRETDG